MMCKPEFIFFDGGDVLFNRKTPDGDHIARELGFDPAHYDRIVLETIATQPDEEVAEFSQIRTLEDEYRIINRFHEYMCRCLGVKFDEKLIHTLTEYRIKADFELKHNVLKTIQILASTYRLGLLSNALPSRRFHEFKIDNLDSYFECAVLSWEEGIQKPDPEIFKIAIQKSGVLPENILFVDNKVKYLEGARTAGIQNLVLVNVDHTSDQFTSINDLYELVSVLNGFD